MTRHTATIIPLHRPLPPGRLGDAVTQARAGESEQSARARLEKLRRDVELAGFGGIK